MKFLSNEIYLVKGNQRQSSFKASHETKNPFFLLTLYEWALSDFLIY